MKKSSTCGHLSIYLCTGLLGIFYPLRSELIACAQGFPQGQEDVLLKLLARLAAQE